jgi:GTP-binding protein
LLIDWRIRKSAIHTQQSAISLRINATFVRSVADAAGLPRDGLDELALVGRSNVGKSSLINALARRRIARTSAVPGKTRLANVYRLARGARPPFYLVDLPGYGFASGGADTAGAFEKVTRAYFGRVGQVRRVGRARQVEQAGHEARPPDLAGPRDLPDRQRLTIAALLVIDARHPGLQSDVAAWTWLLGAVEQAAIVATKIDKLARGQRIRAVGDIESVHEHPVLPVSAITGEGLDDLWKLIDKLLTSE